MLFVGRAGRTRYLTSLRSIKKGTLTLTQKVTCLVCGWGWEITGEEKRLVWFCGFNTVWWEGGAGL